MPRVTSGSLSPRQWSIGHFLYLRHKLLQAEAYCRLLFQYCRSPGESPPGHQRDEVRYLRAVRGEGGGLQLNDEGTLSEKRPSGRGKQSSWETTVAVEAALLTAGLLRG